MSNLLAAITLTQSYALPAVDDSVLNDLRNYTVVTGTFDSESATHLVFHYNPSAVIRSDAFTTVDTTFGRVFDLGFTITATGGTKTVSAAIKLAGVYVGYSTGTVSVPAGTASYSLTFDTGGLSFDQIELAFYDDLGSSGAATCDLSAVTLANRDFSSLVAGDRVLIYWTGTDFQVQLEDATSQQVTTITDGPYLGEIDISQVSGIIVSDLPGDIYAKSAYSFCSGLDLVQFKLLTTDSDFPYMTKYLTVNSSACALTPVSCDVYFGNPATITGASSAYVASGQVQLGTAYSSHGSIRYSNVYSPAVYLGQYQNLTNTSGLFTGLAAGTYTFYAVDPYNCYASVTIVIPNTSEDAYGAKYRVQYYDVELSVQTVADIQERAFTGDVTYSIATSDPVIISKTSGELNNKFDVLRPTFAEVNLISERHFQYLGLFSQDDRRYKLSYTHGTTLWKGFLIPSTYSETYSPSKNYPITLKFGDGLANLGEYDFVDDSGNSITASVSLLTIISTILKKIDLKLDIYSCVNKYATGMSTGATDDPLYQTYIEGISFYDSDGVPQKCDEVLTAILKPFGAFIIQKDGAWHIIETDAQTASYNYRKYDYTGAYVSNGSINPVLNIDRPYVTLENVLFTGADHSLEIIPAYGKISIEHALKVRPSIFPLSLDKWQVNSSSVGYGLPYPVKPTVKGMEFFPGATTGWTGYCSLFSPLFNVTSYNDSVNISFNYQVTMDRFATFTDSYTGLTFHGGVLPEPPWVKFVWRLLLNYNSVEYYYNESIGWHRTAAIATSSTPVAIPTNPTSKSLTIDTGLTLPAGSVIKVQKDSTNYFRATVTSYNSGTGALVCLSYASLGSYSGTGPWTIYAAGTEYIDNWVYTSNYSNELQSFDKDVVLPHLYIPYAIDLQLQVVAYGERSLDFTSLTTLRAIPSAIYPVGHEIMGTDPVNSAYLRWYKLVEDNEADNGATTATKVRPDDYNGSYNMVLWSSTEYENDAGNHVPKYVNTIKSIKVQDVIVKYLPNQAEPTDKETIQFTNDIRYKENLDYSLSAGDLPTSIISPEIYTNVFTLSDGTRTRNWSRSGVSEVGSIQVLLMRSLGNQYNKPGWRLSGSWLAPDMKVNSVMKHRINAQNFSITNPEAPNGTGWSQSGSGQAWTGTSGTCVVVFSPILTGNSTYVKQSATFVPGQRISIAFDLTRTLTADTRIDRFVCVIFNGASVRQKITLADGLQYDTQILRTVSFDVDSSATDIGFFVENISGSGTCTYTLNYFRGTDLNIVRYYYSNAYSRNDKHNLYRNELVQLIPAEISTDVTIDDTGGGNTTGNDNTGGVQGRDFSEGFSNGFS